MGSVKSIGLKTVLLPFVKHLVIDVGNTKTKYGIFAAEQLLKVISVVESVPGLQLASLVKEFDPAKILLSDVSGTWDTLDLGTPILRLDAQTTLPFINRYASPQTLGSDRKALVAAALHFYPNTNCLVIDAGTCVTYDLLNASKEYLGGAISPGLQMRLKAMHTFTGKLPLPEWTEDLSLLGTDTDSCLRSGAYHGMVGEMEGFISCFSELLGSIQVLLTGGDAPLLAKNLKSGIFAQEHLLLFGLNSILLKHAN